MREPATSCTTCGAALPPAEVLYTAEGEPACGACWIDPGLRARPRRWLGARPVPPSPARTARARRVSVFRWSLLFAILAAMSLHVRQIALTELRMVCPRVTIDAPAPTASVPAHFIVRGHVVTDTITRPLWVVTRSSRPSPSILGESRGIDLLPRPVVADMFGEFAVPVDLLGREGQRYQISIVSADELANGWLESAPAFLSLSGRLRPLAEGAHRSCVAGAMELAAATSGMTVLATVSVALGPSAR